MSDIDEADREGDQEHGGALPRKLTQGARDSLVFSSRVDHGPTTTAVWSLIHGIDVLHALVLSQQAEITGLRERLETYISRSGSALSAARMHIPIGGGDVFWRRQQDRKERERLELRAEQLRLAKETVMDPELVQELGFVEKPEAKPRKRSTKTTRRK